jgi:hypothetical protein
MKVLICGDRNWSNIERVVDKLMELQDRGYTTLIEGEANGADRIAKEAAKVLGLLLKHILQIGKNMVKLLDLFVTDRCWSKESLI